MPMTDWVAAEKALLAWVRLACTLDAQHVFLGEQDGNSAPPIWATVSIGDAQSRGVAQLTRGATNHTDRTIAFTAIDDKEQMVTFRAFSDQKTGNRTARALLELVQTYAPVPAVRDALNDAGLGLLQVGRVQSLPRVRNAGFESQAILEARFYLMQTAAVSVPYIETVNGTGVFTDAGGAEIDFDFSFEP
jgi:hypothetical protein